MECSMVRFIPAGYEEIRYGHGSDPVHNYTREILKFRPSWLTSARQIAGVKPVAFVAGQVEYGEAVVIERASQLFLDLVEDLANDEGILVGLGPKDSPLVLIDELDIQVVLEYNRLAVYVDNFPGQYFELQDEGLLVWKEEGTVFLYA